MFALLFSCVLALAGTPASTSHNGADALFTQALALDVGVDNRLSEKAAVAAAYKSACEAGASLACEPSVWQRAGRFDRSAAAEAFRMPCGDGEPNACLALAWSLAVLPDGELDDTAPPEARLHLDRACKDGLLRACVERGALLMRGIGGPSDPDTAVTLFSRTCDQGEPLGCWRLGVASQTGLGTTRDPEAAASLFAQACEAGELLGCNALALADHLGIFGTKDLARAAQRYADACDAGLKASCENLTALFDATLSAGQVDASLAPTLAIGCDRKLAAACGLLGDVSERESALTAWTTGCELGNGLSCLRLGEAAPLGPEREGPFAKGCGLNYGPACAALGDLRSKPAGALPRDLTSAAKAWATACQLGHTAACMPAADALRKGKGVEKDPTAAVALYRRACENGVAKACKRAE